MKNLTLILILGISLTSSGCRRARELIRGKESSSSDSSTVSQPIGEQPQTSIQVHIHMVVKNGSAIAAEYDDPVSITVNAGQTIEAIGNMPSMQFSYQTNHQGTFSVVLLANNILKATWITDSTCIRTITQAPPHTIGVGKTIDKVFYRRDVLIAVQ